MISKERLLEIGKNKGLKNKEHIEKDYFQDIFLFNLYKKTNLFIFKGGTALYKLYNLPRFSEDLDFSSLEDSGKTEEIIKEVIASVNSFSIRSLKKIHDSLLIKISVEGILTDYNTLRIDINLKNKPLKEADIKNLIPEYIDISPFSLQVLKVDEIISEKIHALLTRRKARDVYDLFFLLRMAKLDKKLAEEKLKLFGMKYDLDLIKNRISALKNIWAYELKPFVLSDLPEFSLVKDFVASKLE
jgi:predicted nucleotidyltransferase component of viral defense system